MAIGKAAVFYGSQQELQIQSHPLPHLETGEVLVKVLMSTICKSDINTYLGKRTEPTPLVLGHEIIGRIERLPKDPILDLNGDQLREQDLITWSIFANPIEDEMSARGMPQKSPYKIKYGHETISDDHFFSGGFASHCHLLNGTSIIKLDPNVSLKTFCPVSCSLSTIAAAVRTSGKVTHRSVIITGGGMLGVHAIAYLKQLEPQCIDVLEADDRRRHVCAQFGASHVFSDLNAITEKYDVVIDTSGSHHVMENGVYLLKTGGTAVWIGGVFPQDAVSVDSEYLIRHLLNIRGMHNYNIADFQNAVEFMDTHQHEFPFDCLVERTYPLEDLGEAMRYASEERPYRVAIVAN